MTQRAAPLLDTDQAAERVNLARQTLAVYRVRGSGPKFIRFGRKILYDPVELDAWIERNSRRSTSDTGEAA